MGVLLNISTQFHHIPCQIFQYVNGKFTRQHGSSSFPSHNGAVAPGLKTTSLRASTSSWVHMAGRWGSLPMVPLFLNEVQMDFEAAWNGKLFTTIKYHVLGSHLICIHNPNHLWILVGFQGPQDFISNCHPLIFNNISKPPLHCWSQASYSAPLLMLDMRVMGPEAAANLDFRREVQCTSSSFRLTAPERRSGGQRHGDLLNDRCHKKNKR